MGTRTTKGFKSEGRRRIRDNTRGCRPLDKNSHRSNDSSKADGTDGRTGDAAELVQVENNNKKFLPRLAVTQGRVGKFAKKT